MPSAIASLWSTSSAQACWTCSIGANRASDPDSERMATTFALCAQS